MAKYRLIVAEKPSVARDIARTLGAKQRQEGYFQGSNCRVTWALGHLVAPCDPEEIQPGWKRWNAADLPMLPQDIPLKVLPKTRSQFRVVAKLMKDAETSEIVCATDAGREGELIFRRILQMAGLKKTPPLQRLWISSMTDEAIRQGFANLRPLAEYDDLYQSARCRSEADWLVGMNGTRAFTLRYGVLLSVGRVQTPTLAILVRRRREIEAFVPESYCEVEADFGDYKGLWVDEKGKTRIDDAERAKAIAAKARKQPAQVALSTREHKRTPPPLLFDLTSLQREANRRHGMTAEQTLKAAQALYERHKAITYPRTDSNCLPRDMRAEAEGVLHALKGEYQQAAALIAQPIPAPGRVYNDAKVTDHHAIIPTRKAPGNMTAAERNVYDLVARRFIAAYLPDYRYDALRVETECAGERFLSLGQCPVEPGWKAAWGTQQEEDAQATLPDLNVGDQRVAQSVKVKNRTTKPPPQHTEATLLSAMEHAGREVQDEQARELMKESGLGTPATRAAIIERLLQVGYVQRKGRSLLATDKGVQLIAVAPEELSSPETTGRWEKGLHRIRSGDMPPERFMESIRRYTAFLTESAAKSTAQVAFAPEERRPGKGRKSAAIKTLRGVQCPLCGGAVTANQRAYGCANWREKKCPFTLWRNMAVSQEGPELTDALVKELLKNGRVDVPGGQLAMLGNGKAVYRRKG